MKSFVGPRLISKEHAKTIADAGGLIGVWTHLVDSPAEYVQAIRAMVDVVGIEYVCIGTDTKLTPANMSFGGPGSRPSTRLANGPYGGPHGPGGPVGGVGRPQIGGRTNQAWPGQEAGFYFAVVGEMLKRGFTPAEIAKMGGGNFCRVFDEATR